MLLLAQRKGPPRRVALGPARLYRVGLEAHPEVLPQHPLVLLHRHRETREDGDEVAGVLAVQLLGAALMLPHELHLLACPGENHNPAGAALAVLGGRGGDANGGIRGGGRSLHDDAPWSVGCCSCSVARLSGVRPRRPPHQVSGTIRRSHGRCGRSAAVRCRCPSSPPQRQPTRRCESQRSSRPRGEYTHPSRAAR